MFGRGKSGERRAVTRFEAIGSVSIGWRDGGEFRTQEASLVDISQNGACLSAASAPRRGATAWLLIETPHSDRWLSGRVVEVSRGWRGRYSVRMQFEEHCPYDFLKSAVRGLDFSPDSGPTTDELRNDQIWR